LRQEPQSSLDLCVNWWISWFPLLLLLYLIFRRGRPAPFRVRWPRIVLLASQGFGIVIIFASTLAFPQFAAHAIVPGWPASWSSAPLGGVLYHLAVIGLTIYLIRRRNGISYAQ
jgi:hypothetical protein